MCEGNPDVVGELVHKYPVALENCRLHRTRRNHIPVCQGAAEDDHQDEEQGETSIFAPHLDKTALHIQSPGFLLNESPRSNSGAAEGKGLGAFGRISVAEINW